jgi:ATP-binding cassette subfamily B protein
MTQPGACVEFDVVRQRKTYAAPDSGADSSEAFIVTEYIRGKTLREFISSEPLPPPEIAAMVMHLLALASPMFFQLVIDKVLVHQGISTLWALGIGIVMALVLEAVLGFVRQILTLAATNKIDMRLTRRTFAKLLSLPIDYFDQTTAGVITRHMQQVEKIRAFLTGRMFFTALDLTSLLIFMPLLFAYSVKLAMVVLAFSLTIMAIVAMMVPYYNRRLAALYQAEGDRQAMLVETIHGMRTVKSLAIEPMQRRLWDQKSSRSITMHFRVGKISITGNAVTDLLNKLMPIVVIVLGAQDVFDQTLSVGALIGFQMIATRVMSPLIAVVGLVNDYQETALSVRMLGEVMNRPSEGRNGADGLRPQLQGQGLELHPPPFAPQGGGAEPAGHPAAHL